MGYISVPKEQGVVERQKGDRPEAVRIMKSILSFLFACFHAKFLIHYGAVMVLAINVTLVCAKALPFVSVAPFLNTIAFVAKILP